MKTGDYAVYTKAAARESFNRSQDSQTLVFEIEQHACTCDGSFMFIVTPMLVTGVHPYEDGQVVYTLKCADGTTLDAPAHELIQVDPATKEVKY